jgi:DNA-binding transcriptional ArsR family regulator
MPPQIKNLSRPSLEIIAARFRTLGDASRLQLLQCLFQGERSVQSLCEATGMSQANASKHLSLLAEQGLVVRRKQGLFTYYSIGDPSIYDLCNLVCSAAGKHYGHIMKELGST